MVPSSENTWGSRFWRNVARGAIVIFVIGILPWIQMFAPFLGGTVAGYLQNTGARDGITIGALAGVIGVVALGTLAPPRFFGLLSGDLGNAWFFWATVLVILVRVGMSALGGALGAHLAERRYGRGHDTPMTP